MYTRRRDVRCPIATDWSPENREVRSQEQAIIAAQRLSVIDTLRKELVAGLKGYVDGGDDVLIGDDWIYGYRHSVSGKWNPKELKEVLKDSNEDFCDFVNVDVKKVQKLIKTSAREDPALEMNLLEIRKEKHRTEFKGYQRKE